MDVSKSPLLDPFGGFLSHGGSPIAELFIMETPIRMDDLGVGNLHLWNDNPTDRNNG